MITIYSILVIFVTVVATDVFIEDALLSLNGGKIIILYNHSGSWRNTVISSDKVLFGKCPMTAFTELSPLVQKVKSGRSLDFCTYQAFT